MRLKFIRRDRGSFSGGLLPFLPVCCRDRTERVLAVRTIRDYGKSLPWVPSLLPVLSCNFFAVRLTALLRTRPLSANFLLSKELRFGAPNKINCHHWR